MTLIDAVKSGRLFKRKNWKLYYSFDKDHMNFTKTDVLADDYELLPNSISFTEDEFYDIYTRSMIEYNMQPWTRYTETFVSILKKNLGFKNE